MSNSCVTEAQELHPQPRTKRVSVGDCWSRIPVSMYGSRWNDSLCWREHLAANIHIVQSKRKIRLTRGTVSSGWSYFVRRFQSCMTGVDNDGPRAPPMQNISRVPSN